MAAEQAGGALGRVLGVVVEAAERLGRTFTEPDAFRSTLGRLGWDVAEPPAGYVAAGRRALDAAESVRAWADSPPSAVEVVELAVELGGLWEQVGSLGDTPAGVDPALFKEDLAGALVELLLLDSLNNRLPGWHALAETVGIASFRDEPATGERLHHLRECLNLDEVGRLVSDPLGAFADGAGWGTSQASGPVAIARLGSIAAAWGLPVVAGDAGAGEMSATIASTGARLAPVQRVQLVESWTDDDVAVDVGIDVSAAGSGLDALVEVRPRFDAEAVGSLDLGAGWSLELATDLDPDAVPAVVIGSAGLSVDVPPGAPGGYFDLGLRQVPEAPLVLIGSAGATRLELAELGVMLGLVTAPEPDLSGGLDLAGLALVVTAGDGDGFLAGILGDGELRYEASAALSYGARSGFSARGSTGLALTVPVGKEIGPITLETLVFELGADPTEPLVLVSARSRATISGSIAGLEARVEGIGVELLLSGGGPTTAPDVTVGFVPPSAVGLSLDLEVITGGGIVAIDAQTGRYAGALGFDALGVGIDALAVVDTQLASDPDWALFASLSARFPGIPLGFGFTLTGLGGLITLNRAVDGEALALGLRDGAVDALLFPDDPMRDALLLIGQIDEYFPLVPGNTVIGPVIEVGWGAPTIITAQLGVLISLPQGVITILGSLAALLPVPDAPVLELNMDALGVIDVPGGTVLVIASLYDSRLLGLIELSGDVGLYVSVLEDPYFLLSVGGYHPGFRPPAHVPSALEELRRMRAEIEVGSGVSASITSYFAVTSNSVQFGGGFELEASAEFLERHLHGARLVRVRRAAPVRSLRADRGRVGRRGGLRGLQGAARRGPVRPPRGSRALVRHRERPFPLLHRQRQVRPDRRRPRRPGTPRHHRRARRDGGRARPSRSLVGPAPERPCRPDCCCARISTTPFSVPMTAWSASQSVAPLGETLDRLGELTPLQNEVHVAATDVVDGATGAALPGLPRRTCPAGSRRPSIE